VNIARTIGRSAAVLATASALAALAGVAQAGASTTQSVSEAEYASLLRSEALNERYGLGSQNTAPQGMTEAASRALTLRSEALNERYGVGSQSAAPQGMTEAASRALTLRSEALNERYGLGSQKAAAVPSQPTSSTRGFAWGAFGIGAAMMVGLALLAGGLFVLRGLGPRYRTT
jgi:hypothetical protein